MKVSVEQRRLAEVTADILAIGLFEGERPVGDVADLDQATSGAISRLIDLGEFKGKLHETAFIAAAGAAAPRLLLVGAGKESDFTPDRARSVAGTAIRAARKRQVARAGLHVRSSLDPSGIGETLAEGSLLADWDPGLYKSKPDDRIGRLVEVAIIEPDSVRLESLRAGAERGATIADGQNLARTLANAPANLMRPQDLVGEAAKLAHLGLEVEVLDRAALESHGMKAILAVGDGSDNPPALATLRYRGAGDAPFLGLVGKGVCFDSGGLSIKPADRMHEMRMDMSGAAAVLGAMRAIAMLKPKVNVLGVIVAVENLPSSHCYRPGDVITTLSGKTIEVQNTDAEGRIVLADAITYAQRQGAARIVDAATLTGAITVALGSVATGVFGAPQTFVDDVLAAAATAGEKMWQLPLFDEYRDQIKSDLADVCNVGGRGAGSITAAQFIQTFVDDGVPWVHLDIAGTAYSDKESGDLAKSARGVPVRTFVQLALNAASG